MPQGIRQIREQTVDRSGRGEFMHAMPTSKVPAQSRIVAAKDLPEDSALRVQVTVEAQISVLEEPGVHAAEPPCAERTTHRHIGATDQQESQRANPVTEWGTCTSVCVCVCVCVWGGDLGKSQVFAVSPEGELCVRSEIMAKDVRTTTQEDIVRKTFRVNHMQTTTRWALVHAGPTEKT